MSTTYVAGKDMNELLKSLNRAAELQRLVTMWSAHDSKMMCLSPQRDPTSKVSTAPKPFVMELSQQDTLLLLL